MGLFSNLKNKSNDEEPWLANLLDDETVPLDELEAATNPFVVASDAEAADSWHLPDVSLDGFPSEPSAADSVPSLETAPFANDQAIAFDDNMLNLDPIAHDAVPLSTLFATEQPSFGGHLASLPDTFDRRTPEALLPNQPAPLTLAERHSGPAGELAASQLEAFGLSAGATWPELRARYIEMTSSAGYDSTTSPADVTELEQFRREVNTGYAALRLLAAP